MIIGVEHQSTLNKNMIIRILNYDAQLYINQVESGKEVRPVGSFVFYTGDKEWTYPKSLKESLKIPPEMKDYINDWKLPVLELQKIDSGKSSSLMSLCVKMAAILKLSAQIIRFFLNPS